MRRSVRGPVVRGSGPKVRSGVQHSALSFRAAAKIALKAGNRSYCSTSERVERISFLLVDKLPIPGVGDVAPALVE